MSATIRRESKCGPTLYAGRSEVVLTALAEERSLGATTDFAAMSTLDTINICVPTPLLRQELLI
jgi:UDP-N-acetyl-D-mannosaminuronate dehydrogenase